MSYNISFCLINLLIDFVNLKIIDYVLKLHNKKKYFLLIMLVSLIPTSIYFYFKIRYVFFIMNKILFYYVISFVMTDKVCLSKINTIFFFFIFLMFSVYGFSEFFITFSKIVLFELFCIKLSILSHFFVLFALFLYLLSLNLFFSFLSQKKEMKQFLYKVSFFLFDSHIEINGLLDSGNSLYDKKTGKPVIVVSISALKQFIDEKKYNKLIVKNYEKLGAVSEVSCQTIGANDVVIPIFDVGEVMLEGIENQTKKTVKCVVGITSEKFLGNKYFDCLLHRELI